VFDDASMNNTTNTTTTSTPQSDTKQARSHRRRNLLVAACALAGLAFTSCSAEQRREMGEQDVHDSLASHVSRAVNDRSLAISDSLDCTSTITVDSHISASCVGIADSGQAVAASFSGTADVDAETCTALLVVDIGGHRIIDQPYVQCFDTA
jgi:hypothetical protein